MPGWLADVRPHERRVVAGAFLSLFGILAAHTALETARDALFLARLPPSQLPWVYLAMAGVAVVLAQIPSRGFSRSGPRGLAVVLVGLGLVTSVFWLIGSWGNAWVLRALYVWTGIVGTMATLQFWLVLGEIYTITDAKRLYRLIGTGSLLGAVAGGGLARMVSTRFDAGHLILAAALLLVFTALGPTMLLRRRGDSGSSTGATARWTLAQARSILQSEPYVTRLAGLVLVSTVALTLADYVFKSAVVRAVPAAQLGSFFATFYTLLNVLALATQLLAMNWLMRTLGFHRALYVLPALLLLGASGVVVGGGLLAALMLKGADGALRSSVHRTGTELLFLPIADGLRARVKPVIDVLGQRGGQAVASIFILSQLSLHRKDAVLAVAAALLCVVWIASTTDLRPHYVELFRRALREGRFESSGELPELDLASLEALFGALNSQDDAEVIAALGLLGDEGRIRLIPALILYHPSQAVVVRALSLLERSDRVDFIPIADRLLAGSPSDEVRAAALRARSSVRAEETVLRAAMDDPSPVVQATAVVGLVAGGWVSDDAQAALDALFQESSHEARSALAQAIERQPTPAFESILLDLGNDPDHEIQRSVAHALGALRSERALPTLLSMLQATATRAAARQALLAFGDPALGFLAESLVDTTLPQELRRHVPRTISLFPADQAAPILLGRLLEERDGMVRFKILRGLGRLATSNPALKLDTAILRTATDQTVEVAFRLRHWRGLLEQGAREDRRRATPGHHLLATLLRDKERHTVERLFRLIGLQYRGEDFARIYHGLGNSNPKVRASSRELLENLIRPPLRDAVLALIGDAAASQRLLESPYAAPRDLGYESLLGLLLEQPGETLRCIAAYHVGELRLGGLRGRIEALRAQETGLFVSRIFERTLRLISQPETGALHAG